ncbi:hypothetical protein F2Q70_00018930 [Brassica cretica]|uniref:Uncharacterized protein n=1 Tax=Brassica cretica TaxID=69181 RepID=A0A8S9I0D6_BRACR|nr:hypothetical protein F2Q70_00018930 [Brassica cretica]
MDFGFFQGFAKTKQGERERDSGFGVAPLYGGRPTCFWEEVAFSAPSSSALGTGRRWLLQHRHRRLLLPGGGGFRIIAGTGVRFMVFYFSIYEFELIWFSLLDLNLLPLICLVEWLSSGFDLAVDGGR